MDEVEKSAEDVIAAIQPAPEVRPGAPITITYTNWRGDTEVRRIIPRRIWWGSTEWHPEPQWLLTAFDVDKQAERDFALKDFGQPITVQDAAQVPEIAALIEGRNWQVKARAQHWLRRNLSCPEDADVGALCKEYGYGAVMDAASRLWARMPHGSGAFYIGGCIGFKTDDDATAALRAIAEGRA